MIRGWGLSFWRLKEQVQFQTETKKKTLKKVFLSFLLQRGVHHSFVCHEMKVKQWGFRSALSTPPGVNQAIPPMLMSPKRLIVLGLFRVLLIGSCKHRSLYLIGSGTALGRMKDWDLSAAPKSNVISVSLFKSLLCLRSILPLSRVSLWGKIAVQIWLWIYFLLLMTKIIYAPLCAKELWTMPCHMPTSFCVMSYAIKFLLAYLQQTAVSKWRLMLPWHVLLHSYQSWKTNVLTVLSLGQNHLLKTYDLD